MGRKYRKIDWLDTLGNAVIALGLLELIAAIIFIKTF